MGLMLLMSVGDFRFAAIFHKLGLKKGDGIHMVVGNYNNSFLALFGAWLLGAFGSCGDVNLDAKAIAGQVWCIFRS